MKTKIISWVLGVCIGISAMYLGYLLHSKWRMYDEHVNYMHEISNKSNAYYDMYQDYNRFGNKVKADSFYKLSARYAFIHDSLNLINVLKK